MTDGETFGWWHAAVLEGLKAEPGRLLVEATRACFCIGPQNGQPVCPCQMQQVTVKDGRYVRVQDLGPAPVPRP